MKNFHLCLLSLVFHMATLTDIDIFYPGVWNDLAFSNDEMIEMTNNSNFCLPFTHPQLSLDHSEVTPDIIRRASFGAVARFYLRVFQGVNHVFCRFENLKQELAAMIHDHYPRRSIELMPEFEHPVTKRILRNVIVGVSFLGSKMPPAVMGMFPNFLVYSQPHFGAKTLSIFFNASPADGRSSSLEVVTMPSKSTPPTALSALLATRRAELGITESDLAQKMNDGDQQPAVTEQTIKDIESNVLLPSDVLIDRLARALEITPDIVRQSLAPVAAFSAAQIADVVRKVVREFQDETLGAYLKRLREEKNLTLDDLAQQLEVASEALAAIEAADLPDDPLLEKYAALFELDIADLKARRDALKTAVVADMSVPTSDDAAAQFSAQLKPIQQELARLKQERDAAKQAQDTQAVDQFLTNLELQFKASKLLTGDRVRTLLLHANHVQKLAFGAGAVPKTERQTLMDMLTDIAKFGMSAVSVPTGVIVPPGSRVPAEDGDLNAQIVEFQKTNNIASYEVAAKRYLRSQRQTQA